MASRYYYARHVKTRVVHRANVRRSKKDVRLWCGPVLVESGETNEQGIPLLVRKARPQSSAFELHDANTVEGERCRTCFG